MEPTANPADATRERLLAEVSALRRAGKAGNIVVVGYDLMDITRAALLDGSMTLVISHPLEPDRVLQFLLDRNTPNSIQKNLPLA